MFLWKKSSTSRDSHQYSYKKASLAFFEMEQKKLRKNKEQLVMLMITEVKWKFEKNCVICRT